MTSASPSCSSLFLYLMLVVCLFVGAGCTSTFTAAPDQQIPKLSYEQLPPLYVKASEIQVVNRFRPGVDPRDVSSSFPIPPDIAVKEYAEGRLKAGGGEGIFRFTIEDAHIHHRSSQPEAKFAGLFQPPREDFYDMVIVLKLGMVSALGYEEQTSTMTFSRELILPESLSIAKREAEQIRFLDEIMKKVNSEVTKMVVEKLKLAL